MTELIKHSNPTIKKKDLENVLNCLVSDYIAQGNIVHEFEHKLLEYLGTKNGVSVSSAEAGLHLIFKVMDIKPKDEIIIPSYYYTTILDVIYYVDAVPVLVDIEPNSYHISLEDVESKITDKTRAIIIPHLFGLPVNIEEYMRFNDIEIIEDCGHSLGAEIKERRDLTQEEEIPGKKTGNFGDYAIFSFYATRMITTGQGGFVVSKKKKNLESIKDLIQYDERDDYKVRYTYNLSDMQAALGLKQIDLLDYFINVRREIAHIFNKKLLAGNHKIPEDHPERSNIYYRYPVRVKIPVKDAIDLYRKQGIEVKKPVYKPLHHYLSYDRNNFPNTEDVYMSTVSVPIYPTLHPSQVELISKVLPKI